MTPLAALLSAVPDHSPCPDVSAEEALVAAELLGVNLRPAIVQLVLRAIEARLRADRQVQAVALYPGIFQGREEEPIRERIEHLAGVAPAGLVRHLVRCVTGQAAREGRKRPIPPAVVEEVLAATVAAHPRRELRCHWSGYHFRSADVGADRRAACEEAVWAAGLTAGRASDPYKPAGLTQLHLDHLTPECGLGWTSTDNLRAACSFCNQARFIYRRPLEAVSLCVATGLCELPAGRPESGLRPHLAGAVIGHAGGVCRRCGRGWPTSS